MLNNEKEPKSKTALDPNGHTPQFPNDGSFLQECPLPRRAYLFKFSNQTCKRDRLNVFDSGVDFKCTVCKNKVFIPWTKATPAEYGDPTTWRHNIPDVPEPEHAEDEA
jgi:hypothetical protein